MTIRTKQRRVFSICLGAMVLGNAFLCAAPKAPGALLPSDTLAMITIPQFDDAKAAFLSDPLIRLFDDPSMKPYADTLRETFETQVMGGLEKQLGIKLSEYTDLMNGQLTLAVFVNPGENPARPEFDILLALDSGDRAGQLKERINEVKQRLTQAGQTLKPVTIRNQSFFRLRADGSGRKGNQGVPNELFLGQVDSFLMVSTSAAIVQKSLAASSGASVASLAEDPAFSKIHANRFKSSYGYGWVNFPELYELVEPSVKAMDRQFAGNANPLIPKPTAILNALGLDGLKGLAFDLKNLEQGSMVELTMAIPKQARRGVFSLLALEAKDSTPLPQIPDNVVSFNRTRLNLGEAWSGLENMVGELAPPVMGFVELFLGGLGKDRDPNFDFRESFFENLGDDIITIGLPPKSEKLQDLANPPSLTLIGSPKAQELADAFVVATGLIPSGGNVLTEREFLGKKIYSFKIPGLAIPGAGAPGQDPSAGVGLFMAPNEGYLAFSMDEEALESYLRGPSASQKPLRRMAGLRQSAEALGDEGLSSFRYDNASELVKNLWEISRENPDMLTGGIAGAALGGPQPFGGLEGLADFSKLPPFESVSKYFHYSVGGSSSDSDYLNYRWFRPTPPQLD